MTILLTMDFYFWKYLIPRINPRIFKYKLIIYFAVLYISLFRLPRKFIKHYFIGNGQNLKIDSKNIIKNNPEVFDKLVDAISISKSKGLMEGKLNISQIFVNNPNYKYSIGSFFILYSYEADKISINSNYKFAYNTDRVTKYLYNWFFSLKQKGVTKDYKIVGNTWTLNYSDLLAVKINNSPRKYSNLLMTKV